MDGKRQIDIRREFTKLLDRDTKPRPFICMYPACENKPVRTHSVSRAWLKLISDERNRVVALRPRYDTIFDSDASNLNAKPEITKLGIYNTKRLSTCFCFCSFHDGSVFDKIDNIQAFDVNKKSAFLLAYRSICHEICVKRGVLAGLSNVSVPANSAHLWESQKRLLDLALESLGRIHKHMQKAILRHSYRDTRYYAIVVDSVPDILCSGFFVPVDEENVTSQIYRASYPLSPNAKDRLALTIMPYHRNRGIVVLSWYGKSRKNRAYIKKLGKMNRNLLLNHLFISVFQYMENFFLRPSFWDSLSADKQKSLHKRFESDINPYMADFYQSVRSNATKYVNWSVREIRQNVL